MFDAKNNLLLICIKNIIDIYIYKNFNGIENFFSYVYKKVLLAKAASYFMQI